MPKNWGVVLNKDQYSGPSVSDLAGSTYGMCQFLFGYFIQKLQMTKMIYLCVYVTLKTNNRDTQTTF